MKDVQSLVSERFPDVVCVTSHGQSVCYVSRSDWHGVAQLLFESEFPMCLDVCAVDHLTDTARNPITGVKLERFEVVANFLSYTRHDRMRLIAQIPVDDPTIESISDIYPGANFGEPRNVRSFRNYVQQPSRPRPHFDARRLGWTSIAQRRRSRAHPREVQRGSGTVMSNQETHTEIVETAQTDEGAQELREMVFTGQQWPEGDETMIINMGPQHPSTHGVLRVMLELDGENVLRCKPVVGYLHTGMEKTGEELTYVQGCTNVTRMDYAAPLSNELVYCLAAEQLLELEIPQRAIWIRMMMVELNRMASHLLFQATNGMDLGAISMMLYGWRERETVLRFLERITGLRMNHNFIRVGGVAADLPDDWEAEALEVCDAVEKGVRDYDELLSQNPIWQERTVGVGVITTDEAISLGATGPDT